MKQKEYFLNGEGDKWIKRNLKEITLRNYNNDLVIEEIKKIKNTFYKKKKIKILEIGCGDSTRLKKIKNNEIFCYGLDPSKIAVEKSIKKGIVSKIGTADSVPFKNNYFDIVIFGFCLYVCDSSDYNKIKRECLRTLKNKSFIIIEDFFSKKKIIKKLRHNKKINVTKMDFAKIFCDNKIILISRFIVDYLKKKYTKNLNMWCSIDTLMVKK